MPAEKIAVVGGGSAYVPGVLSAFTTTGEALAGSEIALMDTDPARLPMMEAIGRRMVAESGASLTVTSTIRLEEALHGATFVLTNFRPGGLEGLRLDETIPARAGVLGQETTRPGGTAFALRAVPQVLDLCRSIEAICPDAWLINYTNPTNFVADAIRRRSRVRSVTLCDGGGNGLRYTMPELLGLERDEVRVRAIGINHHTWVVELRIGGGDGYPYLREFARRFAVVPADADRRTRFRAFGAWMLERYGVWPGNESYLYPYFHYEEALADFHAGHSLYQMFMRDLPEHWRRFAAMADGSAPIYLDPSKHHTDVGHGDIVVQVMVAIATNATQEFHVNTSNQGAIANLPYGTIVEVPALVDASGIRPLCMGELPKGFAGLTQALLAWQELSVDAALTGDRNLVVQAMLAHPWIDSVAVAERLCDELLAAHAAFLPQFSA